MAYNPIKRLRSWFFNDNVPTEPRTYINSQGDEVTKQVKTRLAKNHFPKQETFQDLLETTFFKSAGNDLQDVASTTEIHSATDIEKVVKPNQLPELTNSIAEDLNGSSIAVFEAKNTNLSTKRGWYFNFTTAFKNWLIARLLPSGGTTGQVLKKVNNTDFNVSWQNDDIGTSVPAYGVPEANKFLQVNPAGNALEWDTVDAPTTAQHNALQTEVDNIEAGVGLNTNGTYTNPSPNFYLSGDTTVKQNIESLDTALNTLETTFNGGTTLQYFRGDKTWQNLQTDVRATVLTGFSLASSADVTAADTLLVAIGKLQKQIDDLSTTSLSQTYTTIPCSTGDYSSTLKYSKIGNRVFLNGEIDVTTGGVPNTYYYNGAALADIAPLADVVLFCGQEAPAYQISPIRILATLGHIEIVNGAFLTTGDKIYVNVSYLVGV